MEFNFRNNCKQKYTNSYYIKLKITMKSKVENDI